MGRGEEIKYWLTHKATTYHIALRGLILSAARWASGSRNMPGTTGLPQRLLHSMLIDTSMLVLRLIEPGRPGIKSGAEKHLAARCKSSMSSKAACCYAADPHLLARSRYRSAEQARRAQRNRSRRSCSQPGCPRAAWRCRQPARL